MSGSRADKYMPCALMGFAGLAFIASPLFLNIGIQYQEYSASNQLNSSENINRQEIRERKKTADLIKKTGLEVQGQTLRIIDYTDNPDKAPSMKPSVLRAYLESQKVWVYDASGTCIGKIEKRKFIWKHNNSTVCEAIPTLTLNQ
jgi:hypothetical protein